MDYRTIIEGLQVGITGRDYRTIIEGLQVWITELSLRDYR